MSNLLYFASLRETLGSAKEQLDLPETVTSVAELKGMLSDRSAIWKASFSNDTSLLVSVNQQMANDQTEIKNADEIAFFPPVTGG